MEQAKALAQSLYGKTSKGKEAEKDARDFLATGALVPDQLVESCFGLRNQNVKACPDTLRLLLEGRGNPCGTDSVTQGPLLHKACWEGSVDVVKLLLEFNADMEVKEKKMETPPLNTALAAGNAKVCLELLNRNADVHWKHKDGASALHVTCAWIASSHNANLRLPPVGEEPRAVIAMMLHNGVDPTVTEGMSRSDMRCEGMTPLESFRREIQRSPWRQDPNVGPKFDKTAHLVHTLLEQGETVVKTKNDGNKAFKNGKYEDALKQYADARRICENADIRGHHMAVLWSNDAAVHKKMKSWKLCEQACNEGLTHYCSQKIRQKLQDHKDEAIREAEAEARGEVKEAPPPVERKPPTKLEGGFITKEKAPEKELYPDGSVQGGTGKSPGPFICGFDDALHAGMVDGCDGDKDKKKKEDQELDKELVREGLMAPDLLTTSDNLDLINRVPKNDIEQEKAEIARLKKMQEISQYDAVARMKEALKSDDWHEIHNAIEEAKKVWVSPEDPTRLEAQRRFEELRFKDTGLTTSTAS